MNKITLEEAKTLANESQAFFESCLDMCYDAIRKAASQGKFKVMLPYFRDHKVEIKVLTQLRDEGFKIDSFDSQTSNTAIHWSE